MTANGSGAFFFFLNQAAQGILVPWPGKFQHGASFWGDENVQELDSPDGVIHILKMTEFYIWVNFLLCELYLNEENQEG